MDIVGIDADTKGIAVARVDGKRGIVTDIRYIPRVKGKKQHPDYKRELEDLYYGIAGNACVVIEDVFCRNRVAFRSLCMVRGELNLYAVYAGVEIEFELASKWQPRLFKRLGVKKRGSTKDRARIVATNNTAHRLGTLNEHEVDAVCIALDRYYVERDKNRK